MTCEKLALIYNEDKFTANQDDTEWLKRAAKMLQKDREGEDGEMASCTDNPVFLFISERLYSLEPSASAARSMANSVFARAIGPWLKSTTKKRLTKRKT